ncbi:STAS domain-containing protein [Parasphingorhabdus pacifica]
MTQQQVSSPRSPQFSGGACTRAPATVPPESVAASPLELGVSRTRNDTVVIRVVGEVDLLTAARLDDELRNQLDSDAEVVVDLSSVEFIAVTGLEVLARAARQPGSADLRLVADSHPVIRALRIGGLDETVECFRTVGEAVDRAVTQTA